MNPDILLLVKSCEAGLQITKPINIIIKTKPAGDGKELAGYCESYYRRGKIVGHKVVIHLNVVFQSEYNIYDVIAHELIHASMMENGLFNDDHHHDLIFQQLAVHLTQYLTDIGFQIGELYNPVTDTD